MTKSRFIASIGASAMLSTGILSGCGSQIAAPSISAQNQSTPKATVATLSTIHQAKTITMISSTTGWANSSSHIFRTTTAGKKWSSVLKSQTILGLDAVSTKAAWALTKSGAHNVSVIHTDDGGAHWTTHQLSAPWPVVQASVTTNSPGGSFGSVLLSGPVGTQTGPQSLWTISHGHVSSGPVYTTANGSFAGITWTSSTQAWAISDGGASPVLMASHNGGSAWTPVNLPLPAWVPHQAIANPKPQLKATLVVTQAPTFTAAAGFLAASLYVPYTTPQNTVQTHVYAVLYRTVHGTTWTPVWHRPAETVESMDWSSSQKGWAIMTKARSHAQLEYTRTGGRSWHAIFTFPSRVNPFSVRFSPHIGWLIATRGLSSTLALYQSHNNGKHWQVVH